MADDRTIDDWIMKNLMPGEISTITGKRRPTSRELLAPAKAFFSQSEEMASKALPKWYTRGRGEEGIYAEPPLDLGLMLEDAALGPVKLVGKADKALKTASKFRQPAKGAKPVKVKR